MVLEKLVKLINTRGVYKYLDSQCVWFKEVRYAWRNRDRYVCFKCGARFTLDKWYRKIIDSLYCPRCGSSMVKIVGAGSWSFVDYVFRILLRDFVAERTSIDSYYVSYERIGECKYAVTLVNKKYVVDLISSEVIECEEKEKESRSSE